MIESGGALCRLCSAKESTVERAFEAEANARRIRSVFGIPVTAALQDLPPPSPPLQSLPPSPLSPIGEVALGASDITDASSDVEAVFVDELPRYYQRRSARKKTLYRPGLCRCTCGCDVTISRTWHYSRTTAGHKVR